MKKLLNICGSVLLSITRSSDLKVLLKHTTLGKIFSAWVLGFDTGLLSHSHLF